MYIILTTKGEKFMFDEFVMNDAMNAALEILIKDNDGIDYTCAVAKFSVDLDQTGKRSRLVPYFVVMEKENLEILQGISSSSKGTLKSNLSSLSTYQQEYFGSLNPKFLVLRFPYLKPFFDYLNAWREKTRLALPDELAILEAIEKAEEDVAKNKIVTCRDKQM